MASNLLCPVDGVKINETKVRLIAGFVLLTTLLYLLTGWLLIPILLLVDFGLRSFNRGKYSMESADETITLEKLRSFNRGKYSPFGNVADWLLNVLRLPYKATDQAPKRFAARIGLGFSLLILGLHLAHVPTLIPAGILAVFAALESIVGFCAGCYVYTFYIRWFPRAA